MRSLFFPTIIVDGFFQEPDQVRELALSLTFHKDTENKWPGQRTTLLHEVAPVLFNLTMRKITGLISDTTTNYNYTSQMMFQTVDKSYERGWVHNDGDISLLTAIVYLTPGITSGSGTSLYVKNNTVQYNDLTFNKEKEESFFTQQSNTNFRDKHNSQYTEVVNIKGLYNRLFLFESANYHAAQEFFGDSQDQSRLTLVSFIHLETSIAQVPIIRSLASGRGL
jgi:hypothetical protein